MNILRHEDYREGQIFDTEVLVIGTGAGGGVVGTELAEAGVEVTFVEEGSYTPTSSFNPYLSQSAPRLYRDAGTTVILGKPPIPYIEGKAVGGSTVINGGMTFRAPTKVLEEWEKITGAPELGPKGLEDYFAAAEERVSAKTHIPEAMGDENRIMAQGAAKLGWKIEVNRRNQDRCVGSNNCIFGCPTGAKQSTLVSYMPRAMKAGARCLTEVRIEELLIEGGRCVGAKGRAIDPVTQKMSRRVTIRARRTVVAGGAVQTPYLLLKHKLGRASKQLGRNFLCHPNVKVVALYPYEVKGYQGISQWSQVREFHDEGIVLADNMIPPGAVASHLPTHGLGAWEIMEAYNRMVVSGALVEDSITGRVRRGPFGMPIVNYNISPYDHQRFIRGTKLLCELHFAMGADKVLLPFANLHEARSMDDLKDVEHKVKNPKHLELFTVHLMGTARMGASETDSVVDLDGQIWDLPGAYVADASVFPTAIGVNPQITIMALAKRVAARMLDTMGSAHRIAA